MEDDKQKIKKLGFLNNKKILIAVAVVLSLVLILLFFKSSGSGTTQTKKQINNAETYDEYVDYTEKRIKNIISSIKGVGEVKVIISTNNSPEIVYAKDLQKKDISDTEYLVEESVVYEKDGSRSSGLIVYKKYPKIDGILVVAGGANDEKIRIMIINALSTVFDVEISKIEVLAGQK